MASTGALPQTLKSITATKINELGKQRTLFDKAKAEIREDAEAATDLHTRAQILLNGVSSLKGYPKKCTRQRRHGPGYGIFRR